MRRIDLARNIISGMILTLLLIGMLTSASDLPFEASCYQLVFIGPVYIRTDGSIDPSGAPIRLVRIDIDISTGVSTYIYELTGSISSNTSGIVIEKDNVVVDGVGYTVQGGSGNGIDLSGRSNVAIKDINVKGFDTGILLSSSSDSIISGNNITNNVYFGISLSSSSDNTLSGNSITSSIIDIVLDSSDSNTIAGNIVANSEYGICFSYSSNSNTVFGNSITNNSEGTHLDSFSGNNAISRNSISTNNRFGIYLANVNNNVFSENNITNNSVGINLWNCFGGRFYHNNIISTSVYIYNSTNAWDDGYPTCGNYWSYYTGVDLKSGPNQDQPGSDEIGDTPYAIDSINQDNYPLMEPWTPNGSSFLNETTYIRADGSIDPPTAPISTVDNVTYTLTDNIARNLPNGSSAIVIQRDNIIIDGAGYTLQGTIVPDSKSKGIELTERSNVTIKNMKITAFWDGIWLYSSSNNSVSGNNITANNGEGILLNCQMIKETG